MRSEFLREIAAGFLILGSTVACKDTPPVVNTPFPTGTPLPECYTGPATALTYGFRGTQFLQGENHQESGCYVLSIRAGALRGKPILDDLVLPPSLHFQLDIRRASLQDFLLTCHLGHIGEPKPIDNCADIPIKNPDLDSGHIVMVRWEQWRLQHAAWDQIITIFQDPDLSKIIK